MTMRMLKLPANADQKPDPELDLDDPETRRATTVAFAPSGWERAELRKWKKAGVFITVKFCITWIPIPAKY